MMEWPCDPSEEGPYPQGAACISEMYSASVVDRAMMLYFLELQDTALP